MISATFPQTAARAAQHCEELLSRAASPPDFANEFERFARQFADHARTSLGELCDCRSLQAEIGELAQLPASDWLSQVATGSVHSFFALGQDHCGILVSTPVADLVAQFERILGGTGEVDEDYAVLPASAARFAQQFEDRLAETLRRACDRREIAASASGSVVDQVAPFEPGGRIWTASLSVTLPGSARVWLVRLAASEAMLTKIVGSRAVSPATGRTIGARGLEGSAIAEVEMPLRAVLVDVPMSIARLAQLSPGALIPVAVHRSVPLLIGDTTIAHGTVGEIDDRVALELTQTSIFKDH
jgi:flagellar motor switch protein FliM